MSTLETYENIVKNTRIMFKLNIPTKQELDILTRMNKLGTRIFTKDIDLRKINRMAFYSGMRTILHPCQNSYVVRALRLEQSFLNEHFHTYMVPVVNATIEIEKINGVKLDKFNNKELLNQVQTKRKNNNHVITALNNIGEKIEEQKLINKDIFQIITEYKSVIVQMNNLNLLTPEVRTVINNQFNRMNKNCETNIVENVLQCLC